MSPRTQLASTSERGQCSHPARRVFAWLAYDGTLCAGCCELAALPCGQVLAGEFLQAHQQNLDDR